MRYLIGFFLLAIYYLLGGFVTSLLSLSIPSSIIGMLLLFISLSLRIIPAHWIKDACILLITVMPLFFIPASMGLIEHVDLLLSYPMPLLGATILSSLIVLIVTALLLEKYQGNRK